ncbi:MAG: hypothetical protein HOZ81_10940 [Streptomyces sp.]|nr:hypothetical protein [Streptomyces sp.]NUS24233.1 hypothetical protein [Streptomyces sp.]
MTAIPSADAKAVVRAAEALTTQVRRIADALSTPIVEHVLAVDDGPTTTGDGCTSSCQDVPGIRGLLEHVGIDTTGQDITVAGRIVDQAPAADEDHALRWARRESLLVLLTRLQRGRTLTEDETRTLRHHVETEIREADTARSVAAGNKRHVQVMYGELTQAQAAIERVRAARERMAHAKASDVDAIWCLDLVDAALAGPRPDPQPTTEA